MSEPILFSRPAFPATDLSTDPVPRFVPGTRLATPEGPRAVETLSVGDTISSRGGAKRIVRLARSILPRADWIFRRAAWPVRVPVGSLGNPRPLRLAADQRVLLSGAAVARICKVEEVSVALRDLVGLRGLIVERPLADLRYHGFSFDVPACVEVEGVPCEIEVEKPVSLPRETIREAFRAMNMAGEPRLKRL